MGLDAFVPTAYPVEAATFFRPWIDVSLICLAILVAIRRDPARRATTVVCAVIAFVHVSGTLRPIPAARADPSIGSTLVVTTFNTMHGRADMRGFAALLAREGTTVVLVQEMYDRDAVERLAATLDFRAFHDPKSGTGILLHPDHTKGVCEQRIERGRAHIALHTCLSFEGGEEQVTLYSVHPRSPRSHAGFLERARDFESLASSLAESAATHVVMAGDFNAPPWSATFSGFLTRTGLALAGGTDQIRPTRFLREIGAPTWIGAPIDHVVVRGLVSGRKRSVGHYLGSDHLPVTVTVGLGSLDRDRPRSSGGRRTRAKAPHGVVTDG